MRAAREFDVVIVSELEGGYSLFVPELPSVCTAAGIRREQFNGLL